MNEIPIRQLADAVIDEQHEAEIAQLQRETFERVAAEATALGNPISAEELERGFREMAVPVPNGHLAQLLAAQNAAARALSPMTGNRR